MKILFADSFHEDYLAEIKNLGCDCSFQADLSADDLPHVIDGYDVLVVRSTRVTAAAIDAADALSMIIRAGAGTNTIDKGAAADRGIYVCNVPGKNAIAVAELALALIMALDRRIPDNVADLRAGSWNKKRYAKARGLYGRSVGVIGLGDIGLAFAERAAALGLRVNAIAKPKRPDALVRRCEGLGIEYATDLPTLATRCDILSFHVPLTPETRGMVNRGLLDHMRPGAWVINTSRGEILDDAALIEAMDTKGIRAGLDVFNSEPTAGSASFSSALAQHPNVYGTHHIGASTEQAQRSIAAEVVRMIHAFKRGQVLNCVNTESQPLGSATLVIRHFDEVGVLSDVFAVLKHANINVEQMQNTIFTGGRAACATIHVSGDVTDELQSRLAAIDRVLHVGLKHTD